MNIYEEFKKKGWSYNYLSGEIISNKGKIITGSNKNGYIECSINIKGKILHLKGHQLAWYFYYNEIPNSIIDHINGDKKDNRIDNLRLVTNQQNCFNTKAKGCYAIKEKNKIKWQAKLMKSGKRIHIGMYDTQEEAHKAYLEAKKIYHII